MKKQKKLTALLVTLAMILPLAACGGGGQSPAGGSDAGAASGTTAGTPDTPPASDGKVYKLALTTHNSESNQTVVAMQRWADQLREESGGRLDITIYTGGTIANANDALTVTGEGGADLCWITVSQNASSLPVSSFTTIPLLKYTNTYQSTYMMVKTVQQFPEIAEEFAAQNVKLVGVHGSAPAWILSAGTDLNTPEAFNGTLFMSANPNYITMLQGVGASITSDLPNQIYDSMSKGVYKNVLIDFNAATAFRLQELFDRAYDYNFGCVISYIAINLDKYNELPADLQTLLDSHFEDLSFYEAEVLNEDIQAVIAARGDFNYEILETSPELEATFDKIAEEQLVPNYLAQCEAAGVDGQAILDYALQMCEEARTLYGAEYDWVQ